jgi:hypothetical protein
MGLWRSSGARFLGMEEAAGSIPASSTNIFTKLGGTTGITPVPKI